VLRKHPSISFSRRDPKGSLWPIWSAPDRGIRELKKAPNAAQTCAPGAGRRWQIYRIGPSPIFADHLDEGFYVPIQIAARDHSVKARIIGYSEIEERFGEVVTALDQYPLDEDFVLEKATQLALVLRLCISQMSAPNSQSYPEKSVHLEKLKAAQAAVTFKLNACTIEEVSSQMTAAYKAFSVQ
jgi:hypothetical protein